MEKDKVREFIEACDLVGIPDTAYIRLSVDVDWSRVERDVQLRELKAAIENGRIY